MTCQRSVTTETRLLCVTGWSYGSPGKRPPLSCDTKALLHPTAAGEGHVAISVSPGKDVSAPSRLMSVDETSCSRMGRGSYTTLGIRPGQETISGT